LFKFFKGSNLFDDSRLSEYIFCAFIRHPIADHQFLLPSFITTLSNTCTTLQRETSLKKGNPFHPTSALILPISYFFPLEYNFIPRKTIRSIPRNVLRPHYGGHTMAERAVRCSELPLSAGSSISQRRNLNLRLVVHTEVPM